MLNDIIKQLAALIASELASGFVAAVDIGYLEGDKVVAISSGGEGENIGPDDRRGNYLYIRHTDGSTRLSKRSGGSCAACSYDAEATLLLVLVSDCLSPGAMAAAAMMAIVTTSTKVAAKVTINEAAESGRGLPEAEGTPARCRISYVNFNLSAIVDFSKCEKIELC